MSILGVLGLLPEEIGRFTLGNHYSTFVAYYAPRSLVAVPLILTLLWMGVTHFRLICSPDFPHRSAIVWTPKIQVKKDRLALQS
jgi:hypothetical protein